MSKLGTDYLQFSYCNYTKPNYFISIYVCIINLTSGDYKWVLPRTNQQGASEKLAAISFLLVDKQISTET